MKDPRQSKVSETTNILVCRDIELTGEDRREIERSEAAFAHVLPKIHRIEWTVTARPRTVEVRLSMHAQEGDFEAKAVAKDARTAIQEATRKLMMQKRSLKETRLGSRREVSLARPIAMNF